MSKGYLLGAFSLLALLTLYTLPAMAGNTATVSVSVVAPACNDGSDNDADLLVDYPTDLGCSSLIDNDESNAASSVECDDDADNDADGEIDFPADLGCDSLTDDSEAGEAVSIGGGGGGPPLARSVGDAQVFFEGIAPQGLIVGVLMDGVSAGTVVASKDGTFALNLSNLVSGVYLFSLYVMDAKGNIYAPVSLTVRLPANLSVYIRGIDLTQNKIRRPVNSCGKQGDLNNDCKIDLVDFSIASYWWQRPLSQEFNKLERQSLSGDGKVTLEDFSILAYYWTG